MMTFLDIEDMVLTVDQCRELVRLGLDMSDAKFCWILSFSGTVVTGVTTNSKYVRDRIEEQDIVPTYTLQELLKKMPSMKETKFGKLTLNEILTFRPTIGFSYETKEPITMVDQCHRRPKGLLEEYDGNPLNDAYLMMCYQLKN